MSEARKPKRHGALVPVLVAGMVAAGPWPAETAATPSTAEAIGRVLTAEAVGRVLEESASWMVAATDRDTPVAGEAASRLPSAPPPAKPKVLAQAEGAQGGGVAAPAADAAAVEQLQRTIAERDAIIADLLRRVEELESRWHASATTSQAPPAAVPPPARPAPPPQDPGTADSTATAAPGQFEVDPEAVDRALERALVQTGALLLRPGTMEVEQSFSYTRGQDEVPQLFTVGDQLAVGTRRVRSNDIDFGFATRVGLPFDAQLEFGVPFRYRGLSAVSSAGPVRQEESRSAWGYGDLSVGLAKGLLRENDWRPDLIGRVRWTSNTGATDNGIRLGSGFNEIRGALTAVKRQDPLVFVGSLSYEAVLPDDDINPGDRIGVAFGTVLAASPETSLRFFLDQRFIGETEFNGNRIAGSDRVATTLNIGASSLITPRMLLDVTAGIGVTGDGTDYSITVALPVRFDLPGVGRRQF